MTRNRPTQLDLPGMPDEVPLPEYGGIKFPKVRLAFSGGVEYLVRADYVADALALLEPDEEFVLTISGKVAGHAFDPKTDTDGVPHPLMTVKLKVANVALSQFVVNGRERELDRHLRALRDMGVEMTATFADLEAVRARRREVEEAKAAGVDPATGEVQQ